MHRIRTTLSSFAATAAILGAKTAEAISYVTISGSSTVQSLGLGSSGTVSTGSLSSFLGTIFDLGIAVAVALALVMIILGGIEYMTTDSWEKKSNGKDRIVNALWGLGLALVSWLLLYTINPTLVTFQGNLLLGK